jgi:hypothetical protein
MSNQSTTLPVNFDVKEQAFSASEKGIPIAGNYDSRNAIGEYQIPPSSGTYVLGSVNGAIQWIETQGC